MWEIIIKEDVRDLGGGVWRYGKSCRRLGEVLSDVNIIFMDEIFFKKLIKKENVDL